jgi:hypothetical protein
MQKYKELSFFISLFNFDKKRENTWSTVRSAMQTFVAAEDMVCSSPICGVGEAL